MSGEQLYNAVKNNELDALKSHLQQLNPKDICEGFAGGQKPSALELAVQQKNSGMVRLIVESLQDYVFKSQKTESEQKHDQQYGSNAKKSIFAAFELLLNDEYWNDHVAQVFLDYIEFEKPPIKGFFSEEQIIAFIRKISQNGSPQLCLQAGQYLFRKCSPSIEEYDVRVIEVSSDHLNSENVLSPGSYRDQFVYFKANPLKNSVLGYYDRECKSHPITIAEAKFEEFESGRAKIMAAKKECRLVGPQWKELIIKCGGTMPQSSPDHELKEFKIEHQLMTAEKLRSNLQDAVMCLIAGSGDKDDINLCYRILHGSSLSEFLQEASPEKIDEFLAADFMRRLEKRGETNEYAAIAYCEIYVQVFNRATGVQANITPQKIKFYLKIIIDYGIDVVFRHPKASQQILDILKNLPTDDAILAQLTKEAAAAVSTIEVSPALPTPSEWLPLLNCLPSISLNPEAECIVDEEEVDLEVLWEEDRRHKPRTPAEQVVQADQEEEKTTETKDIEEVKAANEKAELRKQITVELKIRQAMANLFVAFRSSFKKSDKTPVEVRMVGVKAIIFDVLFRALGHLLKQSVSSSIIVKPIQEFFVTVQSNAMSIPPRDLIRLVQLSGVFETLDIVMRAQFLLNYFCNSAQQKSTEEKADQKAETTPVVVLSNEEQFARTQFYKMIEQFFGDLKEQLNPALFLKSIAIYLSRDHLLSRKHDIFKYFAECIRTKKIDIQFALEIMEQLLSTDNPDFAMHCIDVLFVCLQQYSPQLRVKLDLIVAKMSAIFEKNGDREIFITNENNFRYSSTFRAQNYDNQCRVAYFIVRVIQGERLDTKEFEILKDVSSMRYIWRESFIVDYPPEKQEIVQALLHLYANLNYLATLRHLLPNVVVVDVLKQRAEYCNSEFLVKLATSMRESKQDEETRYEDKSSILDLMWQSSSLIARIDDDSLDRLPRRPGTAVENIVFFATIDKLTPTLKQHYYQALTAEEYDVLTSELEKVSCHHAVRHELAELAFKRWQARAGSEIFTTDLQQALSHARFLADCYHPYCKAFIVLQAILDELEKIALPELDPDMRQRLVVTKLNLLNYQAKYQFYKDNLAKRLADRSQSLSDKDTCLDTAVKNLERAAECYSSVLATETPETKASSDSTIVADFEREKEHAWLQVFKLMDNDEHNAYYTKQVWSAVHARLSFKVCITILNCYFDYVDQSTIKMQVHGSKLTSLAKKLELASEEKNSNQAAADNVEQKCEARLQVVLKCIAKTATHRDKDYRAVYLIFGLKWIVDLPPLPVLKEFQLAKQKAQKSGETYQLDETEKNNYINYLLQCFNARNRAIVGQIIESSIFSPTELLIRFCQGCPKTIGFLSHNEIVMNYRESLVIFLEHCLSNNLLPIDDVLNKINERPAKYNTDDYEFTPMVFKLYECFTGEQRARVLVAGITQCLEFNDKKPTAATYQFLGREIVRLKILAPKEKELRLKFIISGIRTGIFYANELVNQVARVPYSPWDDAEKYQIFCVCLDVYFYPIANCALPSSNSEPGNSDKTPLWIKVEVDIEDGSLSAPFIIRYLIVLFQRSTKPSHVIITKLLDYLAKGILKTDAAIAALRAEVESSCVERMLNLVEHYQVFVNAEAPGNRVERFMQLLFNDVQLDEEKESKTTVVVSAIGSADEKSTSNTTAKLESKASTCSTEEKNNALDTTVKTIVETFDTRHKLVIAEFEKRKKSPNAAWRNCLNEVLFLNINQLFGRCLQQNNFNSCRLLLQQCRSWGIITKNISNCYKDLEVAVVKYRPEIKDENYRVQLMRLVENEYQQQDAAIGHLEVLNQVEVSWFKKSTDEKQAARERARVIYNMLDFGRFHEKSCNAPDLAREIHKLLKPLEGTLWNSAIYDAFARYLDIIPAACARDFLFELGREAHENPRHFSERPEDPNSQKDPIVPYLQDKLPRKLLEQLKNKDSGLSNQALWLLFCEVIEELRDGRKIENLTNMILVRQRWMEKGMNPPDWLYDDSLLYRPKKYFMCYTRS